MIMSHTPGPRECRKASHQASSPTPTVSGSDQAWCRQQNGAQVCETWKKWLCMSVEVTQDSPWKPKGTEGLHKWVEYNPYLSISHIWQLFG